MIQKRGGGAKQIHINIRVMDTEYKVFKSLGEPKVVLLSMIHANMNAVQKLRCEIEQNNELIEATLQRNVALEKMIQSAQQNDVVNQVSPEIEEKRTKLTAALILTPYEKWTPLHRQSAIESKLWANKSELKTWVLRKQNGGSEIIPTIPAI